MGAGRKTETIIASERLPCAPMTASSCVPMRNLSKNNLGGLIFGCKHNTMAECLAKQLFGLPSSHFSYVRNIKPGLPLFLFNYSDRKMHGIYEAASNGALSIDPYAWTNDGKERTSFPAQVLIRVRMQCQPLKENQFRNIITDNYYKPKLFWFELDHTQTEGLISLFTPVPVSSDTMWTSGPSIKATKSTATDNSISGTGESNRDTEPFFISRNNFTPFNWDNGEVEQGSSSKTSTSAPEERDYRQTVSDLDNWRDEESMLSGLSGVSHQLVKESQTSSENQCNDGVVETREAREVLLQVSAGSSTSPSVVYNGDGVISCVPSDMHKESLIQEENKTTSDLCHGDGELVDIIKELEERTTALENKQVESDLQMQQLSNVLKELEGKNQQLTRYIKKLESKLNSSTSLVDGASNRLVEQHLGSERVIYLIGGYNGTWLSTLDCFSPSTDTIMPLKLMSSARSYASATALNENIFVFGGGDGSSWSNTVECYNRGRDEWTLCAPLIRGKGSLGGATLNNKIFAIGGGDGCESFSDVEMFDPALGRWINHHSMLEKRFSPAAAELNGILYAVGGYDGKTYLQSAERYDPRVPYWTRLPNMNIHRGSHALAVLNEKLYVIGGFDGEKMVSSVEVFDPRLDTWVMGEPMHLARGYAAAAVIDDSLLIIGGLQDCKEINNNILNSVEYFREGTGWVTCDYKAIGKRCFFSAIVS